MAIATTERRQRAAMGALLALAFTSFCYVTAETLPIGLLPQMAKGLDVSDAQIGLLLTLYAAVAGLTAIPLTALTVHVPRRGLLIALVVVFAVSQLATAVAPDYELLVAARLLCAFTHGVFWSIIAPVAARLGPADRQARATSIVFAGTSFAIVAGVPLGTALGYLVGWRVAMAAVGVAGIVAVIALAVKLPALPPEADSAGALSALRTIPGVLRNRALAGICAATLLLVIGDFAAYTYIALIVRHDSGLQGVALAAVLFGYGIAGVIGNAIGGALSDRRPRMGMLFTMGGVCLALSVLAVAQGALATAFAVLIWGAAFIAAPVGLQSAVLRVADGAADTASAVYVVAFQIGIGGGALIGALLVDQGWLRPLPALGAVTAALAAIAVLMTPRAFPRRLVARSVAR